MSSYFSSRSLLLVLSLFLVSAVGAQADLIWDFYDGGGNLNGWTVLHGEAHFRGGDGDGMTPGNGSGGFAHDGGHTTFLVESPAFNFTGGTLDGTNTFRWVSSGGAGNQSGTAAPANQGSVIGYNGGNSNNGGQKGLAFLNTSTNSYDAVLFNSGNGGTDTYNLTSSALMSAGLNLGQQYKLQYYEHDDGGWGWGQLNSVEVAGAFGPVRHEIGGDGAFGTELLSGIQSNSITAPGVDGAKRIRIVQNMNETIQIAELQAFETLTGTNKALQSEGGVATAKDSGHGGVPSRANDGNTNGNYGSGSVFHSNSGKDAWLQIELSAETDLDSVHFWGRTDCCQNRQDDFNLIIENASGDVLYNQQHTGIGTSSGRNQLIPLESIVSADLAATLNPHDSGAGYTYVFELGADTLAIDNPDPSVFTTYLDINNAAFEAEWIDGTQPVDLAAGDTFDLLDADVILGNYNSLVLPELTGGLEWNIDEFLLTGQLSVQMVPEPATIAIWSLLGLSFAGVIARRRRR